MMEGLWEEDSEGQEGGDDPYDPQASGTRPITAVLAADYGGHAVWRNQGR